MKKLFLPILLLILLFTACQSTEIKSTNTIAIADINSMTIIV